MISGAVETAKIVLKVAIVVIVIIAVTAIVLTLVSLFINLFDRIIPASVSEFLQLIGYLLPINTEFFSVVSAGAISVVAAFLTFFTSKMIWNFAKDL